MRQILLIIVLLFLSACNDDKKYYAYTEESTGEVQGRFNTMATCMANENIVNYQGKLSSRRLMDNTTCKWQ